MRDPGDEVGNKSVSPIRDGIGALVSLTPEAYASADTLDTIVLIKLAS